MDYIDFNEKMYLELKRLYKKKVEEGKESFMFKGREMLIVYAKYVLEALSERYEKKKKK